MLRTMIMGLSILGLTAVAAAEPVTVVEAQLQKKLVNRVPPKYPPAAKQAGVEGTVRLQVVLKKNGTVKTVEALGGPDELIPPSIEAVRQWTFEPTLVNAMPVEVITDISLNFTPARK
jgi:TonB family protein